MHLLNAPAVAIVCAMIWGLGKGVLLLDGISTASLSIVHGALPAGYQRHARTEIRGLKYVWGIDK